MHSTIMPVFLQEDRPVTDISKAEKMASLQQLHWLRQRPSGKRMFNSVAALLAVALLFAQSTELFHSHDSDLSKQFDCEICLKLSSLEDAVQAPQLATHLTSFTPEYFYLPVSPALLVTRHFNSRAPPLNA